MASQKILEHDYSVQVESEIQRKIHIKNSLCSSDNVAVFHFSSLEMQATENATKQSFRKNVINKAKSVKCVNWFLFPIRSIIYASENRIKSSQIRQKNYLN